MARVRISRHKSIKSAVQTAASAVMDLNLDELVMRETTKLNRLGLDNRVNTSGDVLYPVDRIRPDIAVKSALLDGRSALQICAVVADGVEPDSETCAILNAVNLEHVFVKALYISETASIWVYRDLDAHAIDERGLLPELQRVARASEDCWQALVKSNIKAKRYGSVWREARPLPGSKTLADLEDETERAAD